jgi:hypothetical protein
MPDIIKFYKVGDPYGEFSNFSKHQLMIWGETWRTSKHFFQAMKFTDYADRKAVKEALTPGEAARLGRERSRSLRSNWEEVKDDTMRLAVAAKLAQHAEVRDLLVSTGDAVLIEHTVNDKYWADGGDGTGKNMLGIILMEARAELLEELKQAEKREKLRASFAEFSISSSMCKCGSKRFLRVRGKCSDLSSCSYVGGEEELDHDGYGPHIDGVCSGDYIDVKICCDCHKVQGAILTDEALVDAFSPEE